MGQCHSAEDRAALQELIAEWWTDDRSGETDPERLKALGYHRFEAYVRYELAAKLEQSDGEITLQSVFVPFVVIMVPYLLDLIANPAYNTLDCLAMLSSSLNWLVMIFPFMMWSWARFTTLPMWLHVRLGCRSRAF